ncbi:hypothetical protein M422DRAFT_253507 [Sphaerobolus stellatus SS14]|uniref:Uncharacterized protein n=1 Tax=Sphaerobolus stellatus (strain SS14) TaxID=990650 RepID=A0A0C9VWT4_SPHS4|nr:hypothetical protein M422DRAFT_253507 [Sphaerobolus stellatus SS14]
MPAGRRHYVKEDLYALLAVSLQILSGAARQTYIGRQRRKMAPFQSVRTTKYPRKVVMISVFLDAKYGYTTLDVPPRPPRKVMTQSTQPGTRATTLERRWRLLRR